MAWAALRSGLYLTSVNRYLTHEEAGYIVDNSEAKVLVASHHLAQVARDLPKHAPRCRIWLMVDGTVPGFEAYEAAIARHPAKPLAEEPAGTFMLYSSGTTGRPKGILRPLPQKTISEDPGPVAMLERVLWGFDQNSVYLSPAPLYHSAPLGFTLGVQALGGTVVMMPRFDEVKALEAIERYRVTHSPVGADHVHAHAQAAGRRAPEVRPLVAEGRDPRRGALSRARSSSRCSTGGGRSSTSTTAGPS